jgi:RHS repeat-associated protein
MVTPMNRKADRLIQCGGHSVVLRGRHLLAQSLVFMLLILSLLSAHATETITYYHNDVLGSPIAATKADGALLWREDYRPYGERYLKQSADSDGKWYTGKPTEDEIGLSYYGSRWYDPAIGRFMAVDPVGVTAENFHSFNRYAYANNNPYRYVDPDGNLPILVPILFVIAGEGINLALEINYDSNNPCGDCVRSSGFGVPGPPIANGTKYLDNLTTAVPKGAEDRAKELHSALDPRAQRMRTTAVTETKEGVRVVSSSNNRLSPAQRAQLGKNEIEGVGKGHAEVTGVNAAKDAG